MSVQSRLASSLSSIVGVVQVSTDPEVLRASQVDERLPAAVVYPATSEEIGEVIAFSAAQGLVIVPRGNGTKMAIGNIPPRVDIVLSTTRMKRIVDYDMANLSVSLECGLTLKEVQEKLAREGRGFCLPLDPSYTAQATLGGITATNASGPKRFLYGTARDVILGLKSVSPKGRLVAAGGKTVKNVAGYDMTKLLIGSWGTLGIITEITYKLLPLPEKEATLLISFPDLTKAGDMVKKLVHSAYYPAAIELLNARAAGKLGLSLPEGYLLAVGVEGVAEAAERLIQEIGNMGRELDALQVKIVTGGEQNSLWVDLRDLPLTWKNEYRDLIIIKSNFLISKYAEVMAGYERLAKERKIDCALAGHAGNGILYSYLLCDNVAGEERNRIFELIDKMTQEAGNHEGNLVIERAPLWVKERIDIWGKPRGDRLVMRRIKEEFDPTGILNRGRFAAGI